MNTKKNRDHSFYLKFARVVSSGIVVPVERTFTVPSIMALMRELAVSLLERLYYIISPTLGDTLKQLRSLTAAGAVRGKPSPSEKWRSSTDLAV